MTVSNYHIKETFRAVLFKLKLYDGRLDTQLFWDPSCEIEVKLRYGIPVLPEEEYE